MKILKLLRFLKCGAIILHQKTSRELVSLLSNYIGVHRHPFSNGQETKPREG